MPITAVACASGSTSNATGWRCGCRARCAGGYSARRTTSSRTAGPRCRRRSRDTSASAVAGRRWATSTAGNSSAGGKRSPSMLRISFWSTTAGGPRALTRQALGLIYTATLSVAGELEQSTVEPVLERFSPAEDAIFINFFRRRAAISPSCARSSSPARAACEPRVSRAVRREPSRRQRSDVPGDSRTARCRASNRKGIAPACPARAVRRARARAAAR